MFPKHVIIVCAEPKGIQYLIYNYLLLFYVPASYKILFHVPVSYFCYKQRDGGEN